MLMQPLRAVGDRRRQLLAVHQEVAVAGEVDHGAMRLEQGRGDGGGQAVAHRPRGRRELRAAGMAQPRIAVEAMQPAAEVAGAVGEDRVRGQRGGRASSPPRPCRAARPASAAGWLRSRRPRRGSIRPSAATAAPRASPAPARRRPSTTAAAGRRRRRGRAPRRRHAGAPASASAAAAPAARSRRSSSRRGAGRSPAPGRPRAMRAASFGLMPMPTSPA